MPLFRFTTDKIVKRLRWVMVCVIFFDVVNTLLGQPAIYWQHPESASEGNPLMRFFISRGYMSFCLFNAIYIGVAFLFVSIVRKRLALIVVFSFILGHYYGGSTWLHRHWHFGVKGPIIYGILIAVAIVSLAFPKADKPGAESQLHKADDSI